jgi:hypothetical protein
MKGSLRKQCEKFSNILTHFLSCLQFPIDVNDRITRISIEESCDGFLV